MARTLSDWLAWQETLNPAEIDLGLERVRDIAARLDLHPPAGRVITVAGTNGKGSTVAVLDCVLRASGLETGVYTSPHLLRYNERIAVGGVPVTDDAIVAAFTRIESVRGSTPLTYFEFGTLAAFCCFEDAGCDAWVLEVGLGGRLDAVNSIDPDVAVITSVGLDHQAWLGDTLEAIAAEKAGIMRPGRPVCYGALPVPSAVRARAAELGARLLAPHEGFRAITGASDWHWQGGQVVLDGLTIPAGGAVQLQNQAVALAALEQLDPALLEPLRDQPALLNGCRPPGRFQACDDGHRWLLDVAHNPQAAGALRAALQGERPAVFVAGLLADKDVEAFVAELDHPDACWILCPTAGARGTPAAALAGRLHPQLGERLRVSAGVDDALSQARRVAAPGALVVVCGSFTVVGPALRSLGLY